MYRGYEIVSSAAFRVTRNSNLYLQEEESRNILESVRAELHNRRKGDAVRLEIEANADQEIIDRLRTNFELDPWQVIDVGFQVSAPFERSWSCTEDAGEACWACRGCRAREAAFVQAGKPDPLRVVRKI